MIVLHLTVKPESKDRPGADLDSCASAADGSMTERQVDKEISERMGHHRNDIKKFYSEFLKDS